MIFKRGDKETSSLFAFVQCGYCALIFTFAVLALVMPIDVYFSLQGSEGVFTSIKQNWLTPPIIDVTVANGANCDTDYEPLFTYEYPGTDIGCNCSDTRAIDDAECCFAGLCMRDTCHGNTIQATAPRAVHAWPFARAQGQVVCAKRYASSTNYYNSVPDSNDARDCDKATEVACTVGGKFVFCVPKSAGACPVSALQVSYGSALPGMKAVLVAPQQACDEAVYLNFAADTAQIPVAQLLVTEDTGVCLDPRQTYSGKPRYLLTHLQDVYDCQFDASWQTLNATTLYDLYAVNNLTRTVSALPYFEDMYAVPMTLQWRAYAYLTNADCLQYRMRFITNEQKLADIQQAALSLIFIGIVVFLYNVALEGVFAKEHRFPGHYGLTVFRAEGADKDCRVILKRVAVGLKGVIHLAYGINLFILLAYLNDEASFIAQVLAKQCTDGTLTRVVQDVNESLRQSLAWGVFSLWLVYVFLEPNLMWVVRQRLCSDRFRIRHTALDTDDPDERDNSAGANVRIDYATSLQHAANFSSNERRQEEGRAGGGGGEGSGDGSGDGDDNDLQQRLVQDE